MTRKRRMLVLSLLSVAAAAIAASGCGERTGQPSKTGAQAPQVADMPPLPEWAPENPSPEFVRAARVLKPLPVEVFAGAAQGDAAVEAMLAQYASSFTAAYEFFGTLNDEQTERFLSTKVIRIPVRALGSAQRAALDKWFDAFRDAMKSGPPERADYLVILYKEGAAEDLSNVDVGFDAGEGMGGGHVVHICFWVRRPDGSVGTHGSAFAQM